MTIPARRWPARLRFRRLEPEIEIRQVEGATTTTNDRQTAASRIIFLSVPTDATLLCRLDSCLAHLAKYLCDNVTKT